jgi:hypothetical protein
MAFPAVAGSGFSLQVLTTKVVPGFPLQSLTLRFHKMNRCKDWCKLSIN